MGVEAQDGLAMKASPALEAWSRFAWLRQVPTGTLPGSAEAKARLDSWLDAVERDPAPLQPAREALGAWVLGSRHVGLLADLGLLTADGFAAEFRRRLVYKLLPEDTDPGQLRDGVRCLFGERRLAQWWAAVPDAAWRRLIALLGLAELRETAADHLRREWREASLVLSARIAATGVDPLVARVYPDARHSASPFLEQLPAVRHYLEAWQRAWNEGHTVAAEDDAPVQVLLGQCLDVVHRIRRNTVRTGVTVRLTYRLQRLEDCIARLRQLLSLADTQVASDVRQTRWINFWRQQIVAAGEESQLSPLWRKGTHLAAREVVSHAGRTGEHYLASDRSQWWGILRSAAIGGVAIAVMAIIKILILQWHAPPLVEGVLVSLNYGLGFVLIHLLHGTVATKQPAMTAARIAAAIGEQGQRSDRQAREDLVALSLKVARGQWTAVLGNVAIALPLAALITWAAMDALHTQLASLHKAHSLLAQLDPLGGTLFYAAIAGICLFLAGIVSGYGDNLCVFHRLPRRIAQMPLLVRGLGVRRAAALAEYVEHNLGAIAGNFVFGCLLGGISMLGHLGGLPLDIRHVAFSSANLGVASVTLWDQLDPRLLAWAAVGLVGVGVVNLAVSFALSLVLALRAQGRGLRLLWQVGGSVAAHLIRHPVDLLRLPPRRPGGEAEPEPANPFQGQDAR